MRPKFTMDIECYKDFFLVKFRDEANKQFDTFPMYEGCPLDRQGLVDLLARVTIYTFNGNNYDIPILVLALHGASNQDLKDASDAIIVGGLKPWEFYRTYGIEQPDFIDHVDVMEVAAGVRIGLKMYAGRIHAPKMQDLPIEPSASISALDRINLDTYCGNDLDVTGRMVDGLELRLALRHSLSEQYGVDLRSKSDAQIAEAVIKSRLAFRPEKRYIPHGYTFKYTPPAYIDYVTPQMKVLLQDVRNADFIVSDKLEALELGYENVERTGVLIPDSLRGRDIRIGSGVYRLGIGGLHSQESSVSRYTSDNGEIKDVDVTSYYPSLILNMGMYPEQLGPAFLEIYRGIIESRVAAKRQAQEISDKITALKGKLKELESA